MPQLARLGDTSSHGGSIISASPDTTANGIGIARDGDQHSCPLEGHGVTALSSDSSVKVNGRSVIRVGDSAGCGATITSGSPNTMVGS
jgi:uncharacterized Zn-binding protein involved in type VI secretion